MQCWWSRQLEDSNHDWVGHVLKVYFPYFIFKKNGKEPNLSETHLQQNSSPSIGTNLSTEDLFSSSNLHNSTFNQTTCSYRDCFCLLTNTRLRTIRLPWITSTTKIGRLMSQTCLCENSSPMLWSWSHGEQLSMINLS